MKYVIPIVFLGLGILLGYLFFGTIDATQEGDDHTLVSNQTWTCSMHPQIMLPEPGDCPICAMDLISVAEESADGLTVNQFRLTKNAMALANIQTTRVGDKDIGENSVKLSGKIRENEEANAVQTAYIEGRIEKLYINTTGEEVRRGQVLASVYSPELVTAQKELLVAGSLKKSQPELYAAVRNKLKLWKLSEKQIDQIESSGKVKENVLIYTTVSGTISEKMVNQGDYVKQGQPLYKIANLNTVWAEFDGYENQIALIKQGQHINITTNAYPDKTFDAKITFIDPILNTATRTIKIRAELNNKSAIFKPGMFVEGQIETPITKAKKNIVIPKSAVLWTGERSLVYIKPSADQPVFEMRAVILENTSGDNYTIIKGLTDGDEIVTHGTFTVDAAAQLQGKKSMMNHNAVDTISPSVEKTIKMNLSDTFQKDFAPVINSYLELKDALVISDAKAVQVKAEVGLQNLKKVNTAVLGKIEKNHISKMIEMLQEIIKKENINTQRDYFITLSEDIIAISSNLDHLDHTIFVQRCPMANNNKGANWLSIKEEIRNPYYGDTMLTCGSVIDTLTVSLNY